MVKSWRPEDDVVTIGDLRQVYRLLLRIEERLSEMHSKMFYLDAELKEDRTKLDEVIKLLGDDPDHWRIRQ